MNKKEGQNKIKKACDPYYPALVYQVSALV